MPLLPHEKILQIHEAAVALGLDRQRAAMLAGLHPGYVAGLTALPTPASQLLGDLSAMNQDGEIAGGVVPLYDWLSTAAALTSPRPDRQRLFADLAQQAARAAAEQRVPDGAGAAGAPPMVMPERVIFRNDLLPVSFLEGALRASRAIARLVVPRIEGGMPRTDPSSGAPTHSYATAWLIGRRHVMTNRHAMTARAPGEPPPAEADLLAQAKAAVAEFDFDALGVTPKSLAVVDLPHGDTALDYAVLTLAAEAGRDALPLRREMAALGADDVFPVNIVQHPSSAPKHLALRNNLVAAVKGNDLAYYADTAAGSSGAPVCDDRWRVVALHREASLRFGKLNYQGKDTAWVNVGTRIGPIIADLEAKAPALWAAIGATVE